MSTEKNKAENKEFTVEEKLKSLYQLQKVVSEIDRIKTLRGELPLEVQDLEDEIVRLQTRIDKFKEEIKESVSTVKQKKADIENSKALIEKYKTQQDNVRNNREYDFLSKEIEFQELEMQLSEKRIGEAQRAEKLKSEELAVAEAELSEVQKDLEAKRADLESIIQETRSEEENYRRQAVEIEANIEDRLLTAFKRIRKNARNGLAVVTIERDACGGCFSKIPPQQQMDVRMRKKVIVCEYCGRILVDADMASEGKTTEETE